MTTAPVRVRFAPSPTGYLHVGGARTALFNWLYARHTGGKFLLRIEDTDRARSTDDSTRAIFEGLQWLSLDWDDEPVYQGAALERHRRDAISILGNGAAYCCFCTTEQLAERRAEAESRKDSFRYDRRCDRLERAEVERRVAADEPFVIRFRVPEGTTEWEDMVHERIAFPNKDIEDFVILRSDGTPIYNLAVVSDDIDMEITVVMRGDDHISNTPKQILLYQALGARIPSFAHLPMIHGTDGKKLSKRHGATAVADYQHMGILPSAMNNFLALLGWSPGEDREVMTREDMVELFSVDGLLRKAAVFDPQKLEWMNGQHLARMSAEELAPLLTPLLVEAGLASEAELLERTGWYHTLLDLLRVRARTTDEIVRQARPYFLDEPEYDDAAVGKAWKDRGAAASLLSATSDRLETVAEWSEPALEPALRELAEELGTSAGRIFQPLRVALTGQAASPGIFDVLVVLGKERSLRRIGKALSKLGTT